MASFFCHVVGVAMQFRLERNVRQHAWLPQHLRIELPHGIVECCSEGYPGEVRDEQRPGQWFDAPECNKSRNDQRPKKNDVCESQPPQMPSEEQPTPQRVERELQ